MIISTNEGNPNALKLVIAAKLAQESVTVKTVSANSALLGRLPTLQLSSGTCLFSTSAAVQYLVPTPENYSILANKWLEWDISQLQPALVSYGGSGKLDTSHKPRIWSLLKQLSAALKNDECLIKDGNELSVVDASIWVSLWSTVAVSEISKEIAKEFPIVDNWLKKLEQLPILQESLKEFKVERGLRAIASIQAVSWFPMNSYTGGASSKITSNDMNAIKEKEVDTVSEEEIQSVKNSWSTGSYPAFEKPAHPVLPKEGERNILITSALPYVNNVPHLGNIIGCVLSADIFARYCRQRNYNTLYICGTDEYGTATEAKAIEENLTPQEICDKYFEIHNDIYRWFCIGFDCFGRTTTNEQTEIVQSLFLRIKDQGYIKTESVDQLLCEKCERFLADRFVEGTCPGCKYEDARGDQCDGCGHLVNATELINPRCKVCNSSPIIRASTQFFLDLPKIEPKLREWAASVESEWSPTARVVSKPWLRDGLKPRCITRDLKWGIPVPLDGYRNKVFYVWFDAPVGYMSITKKYTKEYEQWWKPNGKDISLYQFMAKDNVPFHAVMFPASLLAADQGHTLVRHIMAIEYLNYEDTKFSKSRGIGVFGTDARDTGIPADVWRFYLAYMRPEGQDSNFNWVDLAMKNNSELLNNLGNFINRALMFAEKNFGSKIPPMDPQEDDLMLLALAQRELTSYIGALEKAKLRDALRHILAISKHGNQYMQFQQPWVKVKGTDDDKKKAGTVIGICCNLACLLSALLGPYLPETSRELRSQLGVTEPRDGYIPDTITTMLPSGHKIGKPAPLFAKIEDQQIESLRKKYAGKQESPPRDVKAHAPVVLNDAASIEAAIAKQGLLVRELKAKGDKSKQRLLVRELKAEGDRSKQGLLVRELKAKGDKSEQGLLVRELKAKGDKSKQGLLVRELEAKGDKSKQGLLVRELKAKGDKSVWQPQVQILLQLKKQLAILTEQTSKSKESAEVALQNGGNTGDVAELEAAVAKQAIVVRDLKAKEEKSVWQPQVEILLKLKKQLAGLTGAVAAPSDKKSKKKK